MDMKRKLEIAQRSIESISRHDDEDQAVRSAALDRLDAFVTSEREAMAKRVTDHIESTFGAEASE